jgi:Protein of unknown function (DUF3179)
LSSSTSSSNFVPDKSQPKRKKTVAVVIVLSAIAAGVLIFMAFMALNGTSLLGIGSTQSQIASSSGQNSNGATTQIIPLDQIVSGGPPRDGIPSIDNAKFVSSEEASSNFLQGSDLVIGLEINGDVRAYPLKILVWHEIVNDAVGGTSVAVTYCPLCFTSQVFNRTIDGQAVEFGTSGKLYNSNLVMYDRTSESLWSQAMAKGIVGKHAGKDLERIPFDVAAWNEWKKLHPEGKVLSIDTGFGRPYGVDPYGNYYTEPNILFPVSHKDDRLGPKEIVIGLEDNGNHKAYLISDIENKKVVNDAIGNKQIALVSLEPFMVRVFDRSIAQLESSGSQVTTLQLEYESSSNLLVDKGTETKWNFDGEAVEGSMKGKSLARLPLDEGFWFSWVAFHPDTEVYAENESN